MSICKIGGLLQRRHDNRRASREGRSGSLLGAASLFCRASRRVAPGWVGVCAVGVGRTLRRYPGRAPARPRKTKHPRISARVLVYGCMAGLRVYGAWPRVHGRA